MSKKALIFAGQGSQFVGMGRQLYDNFEVAKQVFDTANSILGTDIKKLCFDGPEEQLNLTINTQPAVFTYNLAVFAVLEAKDFHFVAGHSLGEICACVAAGSLNLENGLQVVQQRARLMQKAALKSDGGMLAVIGLHPGQLAVEIEQFPSLHLSNFNSPLQTTVSGPKKDLAKAKEKLVSLAKMVVDLAVSGAFHSPYMEEAADKFKDYLEEIPFADVKTPVIANIDALPKQKGRDIKKALAEQISAPVQFVKSLDYLQKVGVDTFIEIGPSKTVSGLIKRTLPKTTVFSTESVDRLEATLNNL